MTLRAISQEITRPSILNISLKIQYLKFHSHLSRDQWVMVMAWCQWVDYELVGYDFWCAFITITWLNNGPRSRYVRLRVVHAPGMPGTFSLPPRVSDPDMHHGTCVTHMPWCMPGSLTSGFLWSRSQGKRSPYSRRMRDPQFYVSGKRPIHSAISSTVTGSR